MITYVDCFIVSIVASCFILACASASKRSASGSREQLSARKHIINEDKILSVFRSVSYVISVSVA
jgi:hypothetical protein